MARWGDRTVDIAVVGAGPAGASIAIGLARLGFHVALVSSPRRYSGMEGISARTCTGLRHAGLHEALATVGDFVPRQVVWGSDGGALNGEHLVWRPAFDVALLADARTAGVEVYPARVATQVASNDGCHLALAFPGGDTGTLRADYLVDARGRSAPRRGSRRVAGPATLSLTSEIAPVATRTPGTRVVSFDNGWAWMCDAPDRGFVQVTMDAASVALPPRCSLDAWFRDVLCGVPAAVAWLNGRDLRGAVRARGSTSLLHRQLFSAGAVRAGDAAMAVDPLSGNGIFQALSSAMLLPAVINTLDKRPASAALATGFYRDRVLHTFERFARLGRDFYAMEVRWRERPFWRARSQWPDTQPAHEEAPSFLGVRRHPVLNGGFIDERAVAVTSDQPLGVWQVAGVELAPLLTDLPADEESRSLRLAQRLLGLSAPGDAAIGALTAWLLRYGLVPPSFRTLVARGSTQPGE